MRNIDIDDHDVSLQRQHPQWREAHVPQLTEDGQYLGSSTKTWRAQPKIKGLREGDGGGDRKGHS